MCFEKSNFILPLSSINYDLEISYPEEFEEFFEDVENE